MHIPSMIASIPQDKIDKAQKRIAKVLSNRNVAAKPLEEMIGLLQWIGQVLVRAGVHLPFSIQTLKAAFKHGHAFVSLQLKDELRQRAKEITRDSTSLGNTEAAGVIGVV